MGPFLRPVIVLVIEVLNIYWWIVVVSVVASWLITFGVLTTANHVVRGVVDILYRLTEPVYRPFRRFLPNIGGLDISPLVVLLIIWLVEQELVALALQL
ncbi:MAG TPA: YggT family protein [Stellaceae bacterium]|nr:YggT family protein [Stellaceae bacterium]